MTVSIVEKSDEVIVDMSQVKESTFKGSGAGGQARNKLETAIRLQHPSGMVVTCETERSQWQNRQLAWAEMERRLKNQGLVENHERVNSDRNNQLSERGWVFTQWRNEVVDRSTGKRAQYDAIMKGKQWDRMK